MYVALEMDHKHIEVLALIKEGTQKAGEEIVPPGPALVDSQDVLHIKSNSGFFPGNVAIRGARVKVENAQASRPEDRSNILHTIATTWFSQSEPEK